MKVKKGNKVKILSGKDRGKEGVIARVFKNRDMVLVRGVNVLKKHVKPGEISKDGGIISVERPIHVSNVALVKETKKEAKKETPKKTVKKKKE